MSSPSTSSMPRLDGLRTAARLRADPRTRDLPLAIISACTQYEVEAGLEVGVDAFLAKPFDPCRTHQPRTAVGRARAGRRLVRERPRSVTGAHRFPRRPHRGRASRPRRRRLTRPPRRRSPGTASPHSATSPRLGQLRLGTSPARQPPPPGTSPPEPRHRAPGSRLPASASASASTSEIRIRPRPPPPSTCRTHLKRIRLPTPLLPYACPVTPVELSRTVLCAVRRAVDAGELSVAVPARAVVAAPGPGGSGDYATNIALQLARPAGRTPRYVAEVLREQISAAPGVRGVEITGPGFLNISLDSAAPAALVREIRSPGPALRTQRGPRRPGAVGAAACRVRAPGRSRRRRTRTHRRHPGRPRPSSPRHRRPGRKGRSGSSLSSRTSTSAPSPRRPAIPPPSAPTPPAGPCSIPRRTTGPVSAPSISSSGRATPSSGCGTPTPGPAPSAATPPTSASPPYAGDLDRRTDASSPLPSPTTPASSSAPPPTAPRTGSPGISSPSPMPRSPSLPTVLPLGDEKPSAAHRARLALAEAAGTVLAGGLSLLGIDAPEYL